MRRQRISRQGLCSKPICCFKENNGPDLWPIIKSELLSKNLNSGKLESATVALRLLCSNEDQW